MRYDFICNKGELVKLKSPGLNIVLSIEGSHILQTDRSLNHYYRNSLSTLYYNFLKSRGLVKIPLKHFFFVNEARRFPTEVSAFRTSSTEYRKLIADFDANVLNKVDDIKNNLPCHIFFITLDHHFFNGLSGQAKSADNADLPNKKKLTLSKHKSRAYNHVNNSPDPINDFGERTIAKFLEIDPYRILIDIKHMRLESRLDYYNRILPRYTQNNDTVPIIISHAAINGLDTAYFEPYNFAKLREDVWMAQFSSTYYPLSLNLCNEEVDIILNSKGLIGIAMEERVLGAYQVGFDCKQKAKHIKQKIADIRERKVNEYSAYFQKRPDFATRYLDIKNVAIATKSLEEIYPGLSVEEELANVAAEIEPFIMNYLGIIRLAAVKEDAWKRVCIGSDLDGGIDPIDICPTAQYMPYFEGCLKLLMPFYINRHFKEFIGEDTERRVNDLLYYNLAHFTNENFN
jgi:hypothetical protein